MPLLNQEVEVAIMVCFEGVILMVGGLGRRQDSRGRTAKPSGALSQAEPFDPPWVTKRFTRESGVRGWRQVAEAGVFVEEVGLRWPLARRYGGKMPCTSGHLGWGTRKGR